MNLIDTYRLIQPCIIPIVCPDFDNPNAPHFPHIVGTGFAVAPNLIATNEHVVHAMRECSEEARRRKLIGEERGWCEILYHHQVERGAKFIRLKIEEALRPNYKHAEDWDSSMPVPTIDIAFLRVKVRELPFLKVRAEPPLEPGAAVATAGFPMGRDGLAPGDFLSQFEPFLQTGIISAALPTRRYKVPNGYAVNIMIQGGASGSPLFLSDSPEVVGILWGSLMEPRQFDIHTPRGVLSLPYSLPTNMSYAVPGYYLAQAVEETLKAIKPLENAPTLDELAKQKFNLLDTRIPRP